MENFVLGCFLFLIIFSFYCCLYCEFCKANGINISPKKASKKEEKDIYPEDVFKLIDESTSKVLELEEKEFVEIMLEESIPELDLLTAKKLRKIAPKLGIKTRCKSKMKQKHLLIAEIQQKLHTDLTNKTAEIISSCL